MGTWGSGIYDNDTSADYLLKILQKLINDIRLQIRYQIRINAHFAESDLFICDIDLLVLLCEERGMYIYLPELKEVKRWKKVYMDIWDDTIDDIQPEKEYKKGRRKVLNNTFNRLIELAQKKTKERKEDGEYFLED